MNNQDKQLLEDFIGYLANDLNVISYTSNEDLTELVANFMSSAKYVPTPVEVISTVNLPSPHFNDVKITL